MRMVRGRWFVLVGLALGLSCGDDSGMDGDAGFDGGFDGGACMGDVDCDDGLFCNGAETCVEGACVAGSPVECADSWTSATTRSMRA